MRCTRVTISLTLALMVAGLLGCADDGSNPVPVREQLAAFAADFLRQILAALVL